MYLMNVSFDTVLRLNQTRSKTKYKSGTNASRQLVRRIRSKRRYSMFGACGTKCYCDANTSACIHACASPFCEDCTFG